MQGSIQDALAVLAPHKTLKIYAVPEKSLIEYAHDNRMYDFESYPSDIYRQNQEEREGIVVDSQ